MSKEFDVFQAGPWQALGQYCFQPRPELKVDGKLFLQERLHLQGAEISMNRMPAGVSMPFFHRHRQNEELYIIVGGTGEMMLEQEVIPLREGTTVRVSPEVPRIWRNTGTTDLYFLCIQYRSNADSPHSIEDGELVNRDMPW